MISELKDQGYRMLTYMELVPKLQGVWISTW
jgi:hypothetical protein